jgi:ABC-type spermidine/putrescine transport system permease subunit I
MKQRLVVPLVVALVLAGLALGLGLALGRYVVPACPGSVDQFYLGVAGTCEWMSAQAGMAVDCGAFATYMRKLGLHERQYWGKPVPESDEL